MNQKLYGGNLVKLCKLGNPGKQMLGSGPYSYYIYETFDEERVIFDELQSFTLFLLEKPDGASVNVLDVKEPMMQGDRVQVEGVSAKVTIKGGSVKFLIAGTSEPHPDPKGLFFLSYANLYRVDKPWGHELWINGQHPRYALKEIYLKAGRKTSLQYHKFKQETNVLFQGHANLHYRTEDSVKNDDVTGSDVAFVELGPVCSIDVAPGVLHRLEAISDILLYETSTPHLDDVFRVTDDSKRPDGRIEQEHSGR
jgi:mannose-6-phosphate isomerase